MLATILRVLSKILFRVQVRGLENVPADNGLLIVANHESFLDGFLLGLFLPKRATFIVHKTVLKSWWFRQFLRLTSYLAVDPNSPYAMKKVIRLLDNNQNVMIFPEGRITLTGNLMKVHDGPGFVAAKTGATILPVRVDGAAESYFGRLSSDHTRKILPKVILTIMPVTRIQSPIKSATNQLLTAKQKRRMAGEGMRNVMQQLLFQSQKSRTLFEAFLEAHDKFGGSYKLIEDMNELEETYQDLLKKSLALGRIACKVSVPNEAIGVLMPNITNTIALILGMSAFSYAG